MPVGNEIVLSRHLLRRTAEPKSEICEQTMKRHTQNWQQYTRC